MSAGLFSVSIKALKQAKFMKVTLSTCLESVNSPEGRKRLATYLEGQPFPHYEPHPDKRGLLVRIDEDGSRTAGRFVKRRFKAVRVPNKNKARR